ncbi:MAG: hypothetical protein K0R39_4981 [Symbiobacteriaceae bacterium]|jgi:hypothetical protein|nr:hypothetical protein [Symbiobacteriaceae bacterium]
MVPSKVIHIHEARRRVVKAKRKNGAPRREPVKERFSRWMAGTTTRGHVLVAGLLAALVTGALVAGLMAPPATADNYDPESIEAAANPES